MHGYIIAASGLNAMAELHAEVDNPSDWLGMANDSCF